MYARREIKKQRFKCWSDQFITNVNKGDEERGGRTLLRIGVMGKGRQTIEKIERNKKLQSKPGRKQQVSGSRPREVRQQTVRREGSEGRKLVSW